MKIYSKQLEQEFQVNEDYNFEKIIQNIKIESGVDNETKIKIFHNSKQINDYQTTPKSLKINNMEASILEIHFEYIANLQLQNSLGDKKSIKFNIWDKAQDLNKIAFQSFDCAFDYPVHFYFNENLLKQEQPLYQQNVTNESTINFEFVVKIKLIYFGKTETFNFQAYKKIQDLKNYIAKQFQIEQDFSLIYFNEELNDLEFSLLQCFIKPNAEIKLISNQNKQQKNQSWEIKLINANVSDNQMTVTIYPTDKISILNNKMNIQHVTVQYSSDGLILDQDQTFIEQYLTKDSIIRYHLITEMSTIQVIFNNLQTQKKQDIKVNINDFIKKEFIKLLKLNTQNVSDNDYTLLFKNKKLDWKQTFHSAEIEDQDEISFHVNKLSITVFIQNTKHEFIMNYNSQVKDLISQIKTKLNLKSFQLLNQKEIVQDDDIIHNYVNVSLTLVEQKNSQNPIEKSFQFQLPNNVQFSKNLNLSLTLKEISDNVSQEYQLSNAQKTLYLNGKQIDLNTQLQDIDEIFQNDQNVIKIQFQTFIIKLKNIATLEEKEKQVNLTDKIESLNQFLNLSEAKYFLSKTQLDQQKTFQQVNILSSVTIHYQELEYMVNVRIFNLNNQVIQQQFNCTNTIRQVKQHFKLNETDELFEENAISPVAETIKLENLDVNRLVQLKILQTINLINLEIRYLQKGVQTSRELKNLNSDSSLENLYIFLIKQLKQKNNIILKYESNILPRDNTTLKQKNIKNNSLLIVQDKTITISVQDKKKDLTFQSNVLPDDKIEVIKNKLSKYYKLSNYRLKYKNEVISVDKKISELDNNSNDILEIEVEHY